MCNKPAVKEKRRNNEKRKEKSRDAARCRRSRETQVFTDMSEALPLTQQQVSQLDKASVMRLAIAFLRVKQMINIVPEVAVEKEEVNLDESVFLKSLEGFLLVLSPEGDFVYLSENVSEYLGISQIDLMGQTVYEYSHPCDHDEIREILSTKSHGSKQDKKSFFIRLKCTLTSKGRSVNLKSATYKVIHVTGHMVQKSFKKDIKDSNKDDAKGTMQQCLIAIGQPIPHPSNIEAPLPHQTFLTKHSLDMKITYADEKMAEFLGYKSEDLMGKSVYEYHHAMDSEAISSAFKCLFSKGQCETSRYRFLAKTGGYVWVLSQATLIYDKMQKPQSVVCVNYVISEIECKDEIYSSCQLQSSIKLEAVKKQQQTKVEDNNNNSEKSVVVEGIAKKVKAPNKPLTVTEKILGGPSEIGQTLRQTATSKLFVPRTEEMSKGFITFSEEEPDITMLKDEPDADLTHLAPVAGDVCVPLDHHSHPFLVDIEDFLLTGEFLRDDNVALRAPTDPFLTYRDLCDPSPQLLSPNISKSSDCSLLNSPTDSLQDEDQMSTFMSLQMDDDPDLVMKAPYIPMTICDDFPLLSSDEVMWSDSDRSSKSSTPDSQLAQLLLPVNTNNRFTNSNANDHGGGSIKNEKTVVNSYEKNSSHHWKSTKEKDQSVPKTTNLTTNHKRTSSTSYDNTSNKRTKAEPKNNNNNNDKIPSELFQQLISSNRGRPKSKNNWSVLDSGGALQHQKATCISQPSDSVLMNLLDDEKGAINPKLLEERLRELSFARIIQNRKDKREAEERANKIRKNSFSLLDLNNGIPSLLDLTEQDYEVNAPVNSNLLQGEDLLIALEVPEPI
ncbi:hypoxia-inducible factor 1-alpha isoform X1 [Onthophagus taurus]|uniref:hypoxia-inducible factor 1-alpha isoform X1 n=1 Tax=Onthophagus taurus TaxID=166361 RepID=UPI0039BE876B